MLASILSLHAALLLNVLGANALPSPEPNVLSDQRRKPLSTIVNLGYASYEGTALSSGINQWLGIAYAAPPLGDLRWRAPADPVVNHTLQPATQFAPTCLGSGSSLSNITDEDCLYLDVFAPSNPTKSNLPVWFFIQGGGYAANSDQNFNFTQAIQASNNSIVAVQINYRVGAFGFLASEEIKKNGDLNVGLLDQRKALHWVQQYIHLFGGNKSHVVIHGDSAGAGSVSYQLTAYNGRDDGLFVGGMMESPFWPTQRKLSQVEFQYRQYAKALGCATSHAESLSCLRSKTTAELQTADVDGIWPRANSTALWWFLPVIDGNFSTDYLYNLYEQGKVVKVPVVVGDDTNEGNDFAANASTSAEFLSFIKDNYPHLTAANLQTINKTYPEHGFGTFVDHAAYYPATAAAYGESTFICPGIEISSSLAQYYHAANVWNYRYNVYDAEYEDEGLGVPHVTEKPAIWGPGNTAPCNNCSYVTYNAPIVPLVMNYWVSFIVSLDPNTYKEPSAPVWQSWHSSKGLQRLKIQLNDTVMENVPKAQQKRCALWKSLATVAQQ